MINSMLHSPHSAAPACQFAEILMWTIQPFICTTKDMCTPKTFYRWYNGLTITSTAQKINIYISSASLQLRTLAVLSHVGVVHVHCYSGAVHPHHMGSLEVPWPKEAAANVLSDYAARHIKVPVATGSLGCVLWSFEAVLTLEHTKERFGYLLTLSFAYWFIFKFPQNTFPGGTLLKMQHIWKTTWQACYRFFSLISAVLPKPVPVDYTYPVPRTMAKYLLQKFFMPCSSNAVCEMHISKKNFS